MEQSREGGKLTLVTTKPCFGLPTACPKCLPVFFYLKFARVPFDLYFHSTFPDSGILLYSFVLFLDPFELFSILCFFKLSWVLAAIFYVFFFDFWVLLSLLIMREIVEELAETLEKISV